MTSVARLLGAECIITGMRAAVATAVVGLGIKLQIPTRNTLADGLAEARRRQ
jgi:anti-anti-sigma regulatory factor